MRRFVALLVILGSMDSAIAGAFRSYEVRIEASVDGAEVLIDGKAVGHTPMTKRFDRPAEMTVEVRAPGYHSAKFTTDSDWWLRSTAANAAKRFGRTSVKRFFKAKLRKALAIEVVSDVPHAHVVVNGKAVGATPHMIPYKDSEKLRIVVTSDGRISQAQIVSADWWNQQSGKISLDESSSRFVARLRLSPPGPLRQQPDRRADTPSRPKKQTPQLPLHERAKTKHLVRIAAHLDDGVVPIELGHTPTLRSRNVAILVGTVSIERQADKKVAPETLEAAYPQGKPVLTALFAASASKKTGNPYLGTSLQYEQLEPIAHALRAPPEEPQLFRTANGYLSVARSNNSKSVLPTLNLLDENAAARLDAAVVLTEDSAQQLASYLKWVADSSDAKRRLQAVAEARLTGRPNLLLSDDKGTLSIDDNGYAWRRASHETRLQLCVRLHRARRVRGGAVAIAYYNLIERRIGYKQRAGRRVLSKRIRDIVNEGLAQGDAPARTVTKRKRTRLSGDDNGYAWNGSSHDLRMSLCRDIAQNLRRKGLSTQSAGWYYTLIGTTYRNAEAATLRLKIAEVAAFGTAVVRH